MADVVEIIAKALCADDGYEPEQLEPGDAFGIDGTCRNGDPGHFMWRQFIDSAQAALTALHDAGFVIVPKEPTEEMLETGANWTDYQPEDREGLEPTADRHCAKRVYQAMIEASQK